LSAFSFFVEDSALMQELKESQRLVSAIHARLEDPKVLEKVVKKARITQKGAAEASGLQGSGIEILQHLSHPARKGAVRRGAGL